MLEPGGELDLAEKPLRAEGGREVGAEDLQGNRPVVPEIVGEVDRGHPSPAELALDDVAVAERLLQGQLRAGNHLSPILASNRVYRGSERKRSKSGSVRVAEPGNGSRISAALLSQVNV